MTLLSPTIRVNRLIVFQGGHRALDIPFHPGVNIIRGRNSSGKTTVMDLLAYSLGSENMPWKPEASQCTDVVVEVQLNEGVACFRREISDDAMRPMAIFWGACDDALSAGAHQWERYPFRRSDHQSSFSQAIFNALGMPIAQGDGASNLTMHQLMRVLYADQPSVHSPIFRHEDNFDSALTRETVGNYLCGIFDEQLYSSQLRVREINVQLGKYESELRGIVSVLGKSGQTPDLEFSNDKIMELEAAREELTRSIIVLKESRTLPKKDANRARAKADELRVALNGARKRESLLKDELAAAELDMADSLLFIGELEGRIQNLDESKEARAYLGNVLFSFCPSCLSELAEHRTDSAHCHLCTSEIGNERGDTQLLRMRNELNLQLKESKNIVKRRADKIAELKNDLPFAKAETRRLEREYATVASSWSSDVETAVEERTRKLGVLDEEIRQAHEQQKLASVIAELQKRRDVLSGELASLEEKITSLQLKQEARKLDVASAIGAAAVRLLKLDIPLTPQFVDAKSVAFSFTDNNVSVNGTRNFSESSAVVLRHIFHLALLSVSTEKPYMRVPRFMMLDGIDDGGMEEIRSHKLQEIIVNECEGLAVDYQLIYATKNVNPAYVNSELVTGRFFEPAARSLDVREV